MFVGNVFVDNKAFVGNSENLVIFIKMTTHLKLNLQDIFRSCNDHLQLKVELI